jgi:hypothetical protein
MVQDLADRQIERDATASRRACPVCAARALETVMDRARVPVFENAVHRTRAAALRASVGRLAIRICRSCGFVFNDAFDAALVAYDTNYENDQTQSAAFSAHVDRMAGRVLAGAAAPAPLLVEIGCGQGYFLRRLIERAGDRRATAYGFDPAWRGGATPPGIVIEPCAFDAAAMARLGPPAVVVARHVIEHLDDPVAFLSTIRAALGADSRARLFLETPCVEWILDGEVLHDFFYEHCSYYTAAILRFIIERAGFDVIAVEPVFGRQYLWAEALPRPPGAAPTATGPTATGPTATGPTTTRPSGLDRLIAMAHRFAQGDAARVARWGAVLKTLLRAGPVALWGAAAKGVAFATAVDPAATMIDCLIDINPRKQGAFVPLTGHAILSPAQAAARGVRSVIVMNPNYRAEIATLIAAEGLPFTLIES